MRVISYIILSFFVIFSFARAQNCDPNKLLDEFEKNRNSFLSKRDNCLLKNNFRGHSDRYDNYKNLYGCLKSFSKNRYVDITSYLVQMCLMEKNYQDYSIGACISSCSPAFLWTHHKFNFLKNDIGKIVGYSPKEKSYNCKGSQTDSVEAILRNLLNFQPQKGLFICIDFDGTLAYNLEYSSRKDQDPFYRSIGNYENIKELVRQLRFQGAIVNICSRGPYQMKFEENMSSQQREEVGRKNLSRKNACDKLGFAESDYIQSMKNKYTLGNEETKTFVLIDDEHDNIFPKKDQDYSYKIIGYELTGTKSTIKIPSTSTQK